MKEYDDFKQFIKNEIVKAVDEEDSERVKYLLSALELMIQMKKRVELSELGKSTEGKVKKVKEVETNKKEVSSQTSAKDLMTTEKEMVEKHKKKVGKQEHAAISLEEKALSKREEKKETVFDSEWSGEEKSHVTEEPIKKDEGEEVVVLHQESVEKQEVPAVEEIKGKTEKKSSSGRRLPFTGKLVKGLKTPQSAYIYPLLDTLMEFNGSAPYSAITKQVFEKMKHIFNSYDLSPVTHNKYIPRWKDTLKWVKVDLVNRGILEKNTEKGIWAISEYGKAYYAQHKEKFEGEKENPQPSEEVKEHNAGGGSQQVMLEENVSESTHNSEEIQEREVGKNTSQLMEEEVRADIQQSSQDVGGQTIDSDFSHSEPLQNSQ